jgi:3-methyladenine DNA glycosylase AlkD
MTAFSNEVVSRTRSALEPARDPERAVAMAAYMRDQFPFLGIATTPRRRLQRAAWKPLPKPTFRSDVLTIADQFWALPEREYQYAGLEYLGAHVALLDSSALPRIERLITTRPWWDTVDVLCRHAAGALVRRDPALLAEMDRWLASDDIWLARSAILHQERWGADIDVDWVFAACLQRGRDSEFFIRKAIGWVLRTIARRSPDDAAAVRAFLAANGDELSPLSKREALARVKH